jgi:hypothetical protein
MTLSASEYASSGIAHSIVDLIPLPLLPNLPRFHDNCPLSFVLVAQITFGLKRQPSAVLLTHTQRRPPTTHDLARI